MPIPVGEDRTFLGNSVDIGCLVSHHTHVEGTDVELADIIAPDNQDIGFILSRKAAQNDHQGRHPKNSFLQLGLLCS
jgi:D-tyrosyl-tRNA(Tyr) deacylase